MDELEADRSIAHIALVVRTAAYGISGGDE